ncbi:MAG: virulence RhuM family protein [Campylobacteraceae bacterium]|nr:virulence RhuM family protein [Campylobacteraceae bacterium]
MMSDVVIYEDGSLALKTTVENDTVWLNQKHMAELFDKSVKTINEHIKNIYKEGELEENSTIRKFRTVQKEGKREVAREIDYYNLDVIISVGYRVKSKRGTQFRIWANKVLKEYIIKGYALNKDRLKEQKLKELEETLNLIKQGLKNELLGVNEAKGFVKIIGSYAKSWALLQGYDEQSLQEVAHTKEQKFILDFNEAKEAIAELKKTLMAKGEATELFGKEKAGEFKGNLLNVYQSFGGVDLLPSVEQKAANLLYYIVKGHPFNDGNKRIGSYLFILFLYKNGVLYRANGEPKINDNALASLTLLVAQSDPSQKDIIIKLIINMIYDKD